MEECQEVRSKRSTQHKSPAKKIYKRKINQLKHKTPGEDDDTAEMLKLGGKSIVQWLIHLSRRICHSEEVPEDWLKQIVVPLQKKGVHDAYNNLRGIALLIAQGKVVC